MKIDTVLLGYRASRQSSTKFSSYFMLFQQEMRLPIHNDVGPKSSMGDCEKHDVSHVGYEEYLDVMCVIHEVLFVYRTLRKLLLHQTPNRMKPPLPATLMFSLRRYLQHVRKHLAKLKKTSQQHRRNRKRNMIESISQKCSKLEL